MNIFTQYKRHIAINNTFLFPLFVVSLFLFSISITYANSWKEVQIGYGGEPINAEVNNDKIYIDQFNNRLDLHPRILISSDPASSWSQVENPTTLGSCGLAFDNTGQIVYISKPSIHKEQPTTIYKTSDNFNHVTPLYYGERRDVPFTGECPQLLVTNGRLIAAVSGKIFYSDDQGITFQEAAVPSAIKYASDVYISNLKQNANGILIATTGNGSFSEKGATGNLKGILFSDDQGETWQTSNAPSQYSYKSLSTVAVGNTFYSLIETDNGSSIFQSTDGENWNENKLSIDAKPIGQFNYYLPVAIDEDNHVYISAKSGIWMKDKQNWSQISKQGQYPVFHMLKIYNGNLLDIEWGGLVRMYSPKTKQWKQLTPLSTSVRSPMLSTPNAAYVQAASGLYKLDKTGDGWKKVSNYVRTSYQNVGYKMSYSESDDSLYLGYDYCLFSKSEDRGKTFKSILNDLHDKCMNDSRSQIPITTAVNHIDGRTLLGVKNVTNGILVSDDDKNADYVYDERQSPSQFIKTAGDNIFAAVGSEGVHQSTDNGSNWTPYNQGLPPEENITHLAFDSETNLLFAAGSGLYQREIPSNNWVNISYKLQAIHWWDHDQHIQSILIHSNQLYVTVAKYGVYTKPISIANGDWTPMNDGLDSYEVGKLIYFNNKLYLNDNDNIYEYPIGGSN